MTYQLAYEDDSGPIEPDLDTYMDFDELMEYCRCWTQKNRDLKTKFKDYKQDIIGYFELKALLEQVGTINSISRKRWFKEIKRLINLQKEAAKISVLGIVVNLSRRT